MAKKKVKKLSEEERAELAEARKAKAEAKEKAATEKAEMAAKKKQWYIYSAICIGVALILSIFGVQMFGAEYYNYTNLAAYVLMGACGLTMMKASNYEPDKKKSDRNHFTGMAFSLISVMIIINLVIQMIRG